MHKQIKKWISAALVASMLVPAVPTGFPGMVASNVSAAEENQTQIASPVENVYLNHYSGMSRSIEFNNDWKFYLGEAPGAEAKVYNDAEWTTLNVPHDYSIDQEYTNSGEAESGYRPGGVGWYRKAFTVDSTWENKVVTINFDGVYMDSTVYLNGTKLGGHPYGYTPFSFELPSELLDYEGENVIVVKVDHTIPSSRWYSGSGIYRDVFLNVMDKVHIDRYGVSVTTSGLEDGGAANVNIETALVNENTEEVSGVKVKYTIYKQGEETEVVSKEVTLADAISAGTTVTNEEVMEVANPELWSSWDTGEQNLYVLNTKVLDSEGNKLDEYDTTFGFRYFNFDRNKGFSINGDYIKLKGVCMHHDQGALGAEAWEDAIRRQVIILKGMGCNSIRVTHNPAAQVLIDICNEEGILIVEEAFDGWDRIKNGNSKDYSRFFGEVIEEDNNIIGKDADMTWAEYDIKSMVLRGKNAPSIIMWSLGNEITEGLSSGCDHYPEIADDLIAWVGEVETDSYRKITFGDNKLKGDNATTAAVANKIHAAGGLVGFNYTDWNTIKNKTNNLGSNSWFVYSSETSSPSISRGVYEVTNGNTSTVKNYAKTSYDTSCVGWGKVASDAWWETVRFDANMGEYIWTGFDYLGEPTPWNGTGTEAHNGRPKSAYFGVVDIAGLPKDPYYLYRSLWYEQEGDYTVHMLPTWDEADVLKDGNGNVRVDVYSNAPKVELVLEKADGTSKVVGTAKTMTTHKSTVGWDGTEGIHSYRTVDGVNQNHQSLYYSWSVPYEAGTLKAVAYDGKGDDAKVIDASKITGRTEVTTTTGQAKLALSVDEYTLEEAETPTIAADGKSLAYVVIEVQDEDGDFVNGAEPEITVEVEGPGKLIGMDNGFQADYTSYQSNVWNAHRGKVVAIIQSTEEPGDITVTATADGLQTGTTTIKAEGEMQVSAVSVEMSKIYYVKKGAAQVLPDKLKVYYSNDTSKELPVTWETEGVSTNEEGTYSVYGSINNGEIRVTVYLQVVGDIVALQNYSTYTKKGQEPALPGSLPAITANGEIINAYFNVTWNTDNLQINVPGTYVIEGTADVFGKELHPTVTVRVSAGTISEGSNVISTRLQTEENLSSTTNKELVDNGDKTGAYWQGKGSFKYGWATAENLNKVVLYMGDTAPTSDSIKLSWSLAYDGAEYTPIEAEVENKRVDGITVRTYTFSMVSAVGFKIEFEEDVKLYEAELYNGIPSFAVGSTAELEELVVDGKIVDNDLMAIRQYATTNTEITEEDVVAIGKDNASVTILPKHNNTILIYTKSEDGTAEDVYTIELGKEPIRLAGEEYDRTVMEAVGYNQADDNSNASRNVLDGNTGTLWHTTWGAGNTLEDQPGNRYIDIFVKQKNEEGGLEELSEPIEIAGVRYLPRQDGSVNGRITEYRIAYSEKGDGTDWQDVPGGTGTWADNASWKLAQFATVRAKAIRIYGVFTRGDSGDNQFVSAAEIRLCAPKEDLSDFVNVSLENTEFEYTGFAIQPKPVIQPKEGVTATFVEGQDYTVEYMNDNQPGEAAVIIRGIGAYGGTLRLEYSIKAVEIKVESLETVELTTVKGMRANLPGTITATMTGGSKQEVEVRWAEIPETFFAKSGQFKIKGIVQGTDIVAYAKITVIDIASDEVVAVPPISIVTVKGIAPELPEMVNVKCASGEYVDVPVTWEENVDCNQAVGTIVKVNGTMKGVEFSAVAQIRIAGEGEETNLALNTAKTGFPQAYTQYATGADKMWTAVNGDKNFDMDSSNHRWDNWGESTGIDTWYGVQFNTEKLVTRVELSFAEENHTNTSRVKLAKDYEIQYYTGEEFSIGGDAHEVKNWSNSPVNAEENWTKVNYTDSKPAVPSLEDFRTAQTVVNFTPIATDFVRVLLTPQEAQWTGLVELEVYGYDVDVTKYDNYEITSFMVGTQEMKDTLIEGGVVKYQLDEEQILPEIQVVATKNALVTTEKVLGAENEQMMITIVAENGNENSKKVYTIDFVGSGEEEEEDIPVLVPETKENIWTIGIKDLTYNGAKHTQEFSVYDGTVLLKEGVDYTVAYKNNTNAYVCEDKDGNDLWEKYVAAVEGKETELAKKDVNKFKSKAPQVILKMKGDYTGSKIIYFKINPATMSNQALEDEIFVLDNLTVSTVNKTQVPAISVFWKESGKTLKQGKDYTVEVKDVENGKVSLKEAKEYTITVKGAGNFDGEITEQTFRVVKTTALSKLKVKVKKVTWAAENATLSDAEFAKKVIDSIKNGRTDLVAGVDYEVVEGSVTNKGTVGNGYLLVQAKGDTYTGSRRIDYSIIGNAMSKVDVRGINKKGYPYTGEAVELLKLEEKGTKLVNVYPDKRAEEPLSEECYDVEYSKHTDKGTATLLLTGKPDKGYTGTKKVTFKIKAADLGREDNRFEIAPIADVEYTQGGATPKVVVTTDEGRTKLVEGVDYTLSYKNNKKVLNKADVTNIKKAPTVIVKGKGNYAGSIDETFSIVKKVVDENKVSIIVKDKEYKDAKNNYKQSVKVLDENQKTISAKEYTLSYQEILEDGSLKDLQTNAKIEGATKIRVTVKFNSETADDNFNYSGTVTADYRIVAAGKDISKATVKIIYDDGGKAFNYTGKPITLKKENIKVTIGKGKNASELEWDNDFVITKDDYTNNVNKGTATVTIRGNEENGYGGEKVVKFKIAQRSVVTNWLGELLLSAQELFNF